MSTTQTTPLETSVAAPRAAAKASVLSRLPASSGPLAALIVMMIALSIMSPAFMTVANILNIGHQVAIIAILAIGGTAVITLGGIDLSVGAILALSGSVLGQLVSMGVNVWFGTAVALAVGLVAGVVNGLLIEYGRLPAFIATLAMLSVARGLALVVLDGRPASITDRGFRNLSNFLIGGYVPMALLIAVVLYVVAWAYFRWRASGRALFAMGANYEVARLSGLPVRRLTIAAYAVSGLLAGVAGVLMAARLGSAQPTAGTGFELDVIAAVVIGGASLAGGYGSITGTAVGVMIIGVLRNGLNLLNVSSFWQSVVIGSVIAIAVLIENLRQRRAARG